MKPALHRLLDEYVLETLPPERRRDVDTALLVDTALRQELALTVAALELLAPPASRAPAGGRQRLLATLAGPDRFSAHFETLEGWFDLTADALRAVLRRMDAGTAWQESPFPGLAFFDFEAGVRALGSRCGCVRLRAGASFPRHRHVGVERALILEGCMLEDGKKRHVGEIVESAAGTVHEFRASQGRDLLFIAAHHELVFGAGE